MIQPFGTYMCVQVAVGEWKKTYRNELMRLNFADAKKARGPE